MKLFFIVNPHSRSGIGGMIWELIEPELRKRRVKYDCALTCYPDHATKIVKEITTDGQMHILIALGGDE